MRVGLRVAELVSIPTLGLAVAYGIAPGRVELEVHVWLGITSALASLALVGAVRSAFPDRGSPFDESLGSVPVGVQRPPGLVRLERELAMSLTSSFDVHHRLRPALVELSTDLLATRRGIDLESEPQRAREALGDEAWDLVRPDRPRPEQRLGGGIAPAELDRVVTTLESI